jgi:hypothetical protein
MRCIKSAVENFIEPRLLKKGSGLVLGIVFRAAPFDTEQTGYKKIHTIKDIDDVPTATNIRQASSLRRVFQLISFTPTCWRRL